jgi:hypothetical protein
MNMSDNRISLIPDDPHWIPDHEQCERARDRFAEIVLGADEIGFKLTETIEFFDCGTNLARVICPGCQSEIPDAWWQDRMDEDYVDEFQLATYATPCCGAQCTLHELIYDWTQGFGRFSLNAMNPGIGTLQDSDKTELERILGTKLRVIYQHI